MEKVRDACDTQGEWLLDAQQTAEEWIDHWITSAGHFIHPLEKGCNAVLISLATEKTRLIEATGFPENQSLTPARLSANPEGFRDRAMP